MKAGWRVVPLGDVCTVVNGGTPKSNVATYWGGDVNWLTPKDMGQMTGRHIAETPRKITAKGLDNCSARLVPAGSVIMSTRAPIGHLAINDAPMAFNQGCRGMIPGKDLDPVFLFHFLSASTEALNDLGTGTTFKELSATALRNFPIPLPPLDEQKRIVAVLDEAFEGLSRARANAEANLADARELFGSTLSHMMTGNSDWPMGTIGDVGKVYDGPHATPRTVDSGPLFLGISSLVDGRIELEKTRHVTEEDFKTWTRRVLPQSGDVVFSYETRLGQVAIIPHGMQCCLGRRMGLIRLDRARMLPDFFVLFYLSDYFQNFLREKTIRGATVDRLSIKDFPSFPFPLPTLEVQREIVGRAEQLRFQIDRLLFALQQAVAEFDTLRQALLQKAFSGELT